MEIRSVFWPPFLVSWLFIFGSFIGENSFAVEDLKSQDPALQQLSGASGSPDARIVTVRFGDTIYSIPRNYLASVTELRDGNPYAAFSIYVLLPDLAPRTRENSAGLDRTGWHDQLRALFQYGKYPRPNEEILKFY